MTGKPLITENSLVDSGNASVDRAPYQRAIRFLYDRINYERIVDGTSKYRFRLRRIRRLLEALRLNHFLHSDHQPASVPLVHIAGTKGKGSTAAMVAAILTASGYRTGLYTSPHLHALEERFRIDGAPCAPEDLVQLVEQIKAATDRIEPDTGAPSFFELTTAMALLHFHTQQCDAVVLEVGLGGRLDSTNVCAPSVSVITSIGLDHQHVLGDSLAEIAAEKAGIIKPSVPVVSGVIEEAPSLVIRKRAAELGAPLYQLGQDFQYRYCASGDWGGELTFLENRLAGSQDDEGSPSERTGHPTYAIPLEGAHQGRNAAVALAAVERLLSRLPGGSKLDLSQAIQQGFNAVTCPARIERITIRPGLRAIVDAAHNSDSIEALCDVLRRRELGGPTVVVFGTSLDKDAAAMMTSIGPLADHLVLTRFHGNPRFLPTDDLARKLPPNFEKVVTIVEDPIQACRYGLQVLGQEGTLVVCGSFFIAAETRHWLLDQQNA